MFKKTIMATVIAGAMAPVFAAPALQTCSPMEVTHNGGAGLSYSLQCEAGSWRLQYSGSVPAGDDSVMAQYRVAISGPEGVSFTQNRAVRLPSPSKLGQVLVREAVVLDSGDLALRDCKEPGCTQYRPLSANSTAGQASVTMTPEAKRIQDEQRRQIADLEILQRALADTKVAGEQAKNMAVAEEKRTAAEQLAKAQVAYDTMELKLSTKLKMVSEEAQARIEQERRAAAAAVAQEREESSRKTAGLESEVRRLGNRITGLTTEAEKSRKVELDLLDEIAGLRRTVDQSQKLPAIQKAAYEFALADVVAQHNDQVAQLKRAMPTVNFKGVIEELQVPKVSISTELAAQKKEREQARTPAASQAQQQSAYVPSGSYGNSGPQLAKADKAALQGRLEAWRQAWSSKKHERFADFYGDAFSADGMDRTEWLDKKKRVTSSKSWVKIGVDRVDLQPQADGSVVVTFDQDYVSDSTRDNTKKRQVWVKDYSGAWKIQSESSMP